MSFLSTGVALTTTPTLILGIGGIVDTKNATPAQPMFVTLMNALSQNAQLSGSSASVGATPGLYNLSNSASNPRSVLRLTITDGSDSVFASTTAAGATGTLNIAAFRQQTT